MKAIVLDEYGGPDKLLLREIPEPEPKAGEIKVRVVSASINPIDWKLRSGMAKSIMPLTFPAVLGRDAAGQVTAVGPGVTTFKVGDRVMGLVRGAYAELVVAPIEAWAKLPVGLDVKDAGALPLVLLTGDQLAEATLGPGGGPGLTVLVTGALGAVGRATVFVSKERGAKVWAGVRSKQLDEANKLGATGVVALDDEAALQRLPTLDAIADTLGGKVTPTLLPKVKPGGVIGSVVGEPAGAKAMGLAVHAFLAHPDGRRLAELGAAVASGKLVIPIAKRLPLREAKAAHELAEHGGAGGKVVLES
jgi:NADPH:quinone reductase-like Zn-dependent oxidoreductase